MIHEIMKCHESKQWSIKTKNQSIRECEKQIQRIYRADQIFSRTLQFPSSHQDATSLLHLQALEYRQGTKFSKNPDPVIMNNEQKHTKTDQSGGVSNFEEPAPTKCIHLF